MKIPLFLPVALILLCVTSSCSDNGTDDLEHKGLSFEPKIDAATSVTSILKSAFEADDKVSIFIWSGIDNNDPTTDEFTIFNKQLLSYGATWSAFDEETTFSSFASGSVVSALYPALYATSTLADAQSVDVGIESPTLYYRGEVSEFSDELLSPTFKNVQAQLSFNINGSEQSATSMSFKSTISTSATLNLFSGDFIVSDAGYSTISFTQNSMVSNLYSSLMIAQTISSFTITLGNNTYEYNGDEITLTAGEILIQNITLTAPEVQGEIGEIELGDSFNITEWEAAAEASGDFNFNE